jgi:hypothetical protein
MEQSRPPAAVVPALPRLLPLFRDNGVAKHAITNDHVLETLRVER